MWLTTSSLCHGPNSSFQFHHSPTLADALSIHSRTASRRRRQRAGQATVEEFHTTALDATTTRPSIDCQDPDFFLHQVETSVCNVLSQFPDHDSKDESIIQKAQQKDFLLTLDGPQRESFGVAQNLHQRLTGLRKNNDCPRCWMQRAHCICKDCPPLSSSSLPQLNRIFLILHHKEIAMKVDTAKLIMAAFPHKCRLVVAGIGPEYQASMKELYEAMETTSSKNCLVLFPDETAKSIQEILTEDYGGQLLNDDSNNSDNDSEADGDQVKQLSIPNYQPYDLIVLDGTWAQARKIHTKYILPTEQGDPGGYN